MSDVLVIGGGVIGCGIAHALARRGASVAVIESRAIGQGASRASAGMLAPFTEGRHDRALQALGARSLSRYDALIETLASEGVSVPYVRDGSLDVAFDPTAAGSLDDAARELAEDGVACERLGSQAVRSLEPALAEGALGGLLIPEHGAVGVPELVGALWHAASRRGATLVDARARRVSRAPGGTLNVETTRGTWTAPHVVLAAGSWAGLVDLEGVRPLPVEPVRGQLLALKADAGTLRHTVWGPGCYLVPWPDAVLVGATVERVGFDERTTVDGVHSLLHAATALIPSLSNAAFHEARVGLRPGTSDDRPMVGPSSRLAGLVYATGHYRNGALLAPLTAEAVADVIAGVPMDPIWAPCDPARFDA